MNNKQFSYLRKVLGKTQKQMAHLLGTSLKAIHSYEQGWRPVPSHAERQLLFLISLGRGSAKAVKPCWVVKKCAPERKRACPAWEFQAGNLCWFINGTICEGVVHRNWRDKMELCRTCEVFVPLLPEETEIPYHDYQER